MAAKYKIRKGDLVQVLAGKDAKKTGKVLKVDSEKGRVIVEGLNIVKKTVKGNPQTGEKGSIVEVEAPIHISNVMYVDPKHGPTRLGIKIEDGVKYRVSKKSGEKL